MSGSAQAGLKGDRRSMAACEILPARYPLPYGATTYVQDVSSYFDTRRFSMLPWVGSAMRISLGWVV